MIAQEVLKIMTWIEIVIKAFAILLAIAIGVLITLPALKTAWKKYKNAKTDEEKAQAKLEIRNQLELLCSNVETSYSDLDSALKQLGSSAGQFKKDKVLSDLRDFCDERGYEYNKQELSADVDNFVRHTKEINVSK